MVIYHIILKWNVASVVEIIQKETFFGTSDECTRKIKIKDKCRINHDLYFEPNFFLTNLITH